MDLPPFQMAVALRSSSLRRSSSSDCDAHVLGAKGGFQWSLRHDGKDRSTLTKRRSARLTAGQALLLSQGASEQAFGSRARAVQRPLPTNSSPTGRDRIGRGVQLNAMPVSEGHFSRCAYLFQYGIQGGCPSRRFRKSSSNSGSVAPGSSR